MTFRGFSQKHPIGAEIRKRFAPVEFLRSLDDFEQGRVVSDDVALQQPSAENVSYQFQATEEFWKEFYALSPEQKDALRAKWEKFKADPCHPSLGTHIIWRLSAIARHRIYSAVIEKDLRVTFRIDGNLVTSLRVGTHKIDS